jgi:hypothetical protein
MYHRSSRHVLSVLLCALLGLATTAVPFALAQRITGDIVGTIYDDSGAIVPGASITLRGLDSGRELTATTDANGSYSFPQLSPGRYEVRSERQGFKTQIVTDIKLSADQRTRVDFHLQVGEVTSTIEVQGGAPLLQTETSELAQVVDNRKIREIPLNRRSYVQLGAITAGAIGGGDLISNATNWTGRENVSIWVAGQREIQTSYLVDGIETRNDRFGNAGFRPSIDAIEEFKLNRNAFGTEFGNDSAAVVNVSTKSGTNAFHGSLFEFLRNNKLDARNFFDVGSRPPLRLNNFGGTFGGPIIRNKLFFYGSYEGLRERRSSTARGLYPSKAQLAGNLADDSAGTGIFPTSSSFCLGNPSSAKCRNVIDPDTGQPFPGNLIPSGRISRFANTYAQFFPETNNLSQIPAFNRIVALNFVNDFDQWSVKIDHNLSSKDTVFYRYIWVDETQFRPALTFLGGVDKPQSGQNFALGWTRTISPSLVNTYHMGYNRSLNAHKPEGSGPGQTDYAKDVFSLQNTSENSYDFGLPGAGIVGFSGIGSQGLIIASNQQLFQFTDNLNYIRGKHTMRFGAEFRRMRYWQLTNSPGKPNFSFNGNFTGASLGDFLLGIPVSATQSLGDSSQNIRVSYYSLHFSDAYKVTPNLTLNYGLRWEYKTPPIEINDRQAVFDFQQQKILLAGKDVRRSIFEPDYKNFGPQFGFAYLPFGGKKTVIRGGFGIYWSQQETNEYQMLVLTPPFTRALSLTSVGTTPTLFVDNLFPEVAIGGPEGNAFPYTKNRFERRPYSPQWNLSVQQEFGDWAVELSYMGNASVRYGSYGQVNAAREDPTGTIPISQRVPYPGFSGILLATTDGHGNYQAGTASVTRRFSQGLSLLANYTYAKSIDDGSSELNFTYRPEQGRKDMRGPSDFDINHRLVVSYVYELPVGKGRRFLNQGGVSNAVFGGWQIAGVTTFMTGPPATVHLPGDWALRGPLAFTRPNCVSDQNNSSISSNVRNNGLQYFDTSGFQVPAPFTLGNCGRNPLRSPGINNWDLGLHKLVDFSERVSLQFRFEFFNAWNHAQWLPFAGGGAYTYGRPGFGNPTFGQVTTARNGREVQLGVKLLF